jgi:hypothetical protein
MDKNLCNQLICWTKFGVGADRFSAALASALRIFRHLNFWNNKIHIFCIKLEVSSEKNFLLMSMISLNFPNPKVSALTSEKML